MSRWDDVGLFWQDVRVERKAGARAARPLAPIPETGWKAPTYYPNLLSARVLSFDVEAKDTELDEHGPGWARNRGQMCGFSIGTLEGHRWYFPIRHEVESDTNMDPGHTLEWLKDMFTQNQDLTIVGANLIYDYGWLAQEGIHPIVRELVDVQFAEALLEEFARVSLETLGQRYLGEGKTTDILKSWAMQSYGTSAGTWKRDIYRCPPKLVGPYGEGDADLPLRVAPFQYDRLYREGLLDLFRMECDLIPLLVAMRFAGVSVDIPKAERLSEALGSRAAIEHEKLDALVGHTVNINSGAELAHAFDDLGIPYPRTEGTDKSPDGKPSFRKEFLEKLDHPIGQHIREIRRFEKLKGTFVDGYILDGHVDGKVYGSFHPLRGDSGGAVSGRFSGSDPNLQNIPARDDHCVHGNKAKECPQGPCLTLGEEMRSIFIPDPGHEHWRKYDYSQIEFRFLVHYAVGPGSDEARAQYNKDPHTDYHKMVQRLVEQATHREWDRRYVKNLNFGRSYGMGDEKTGLTTGLKGDALKEFIEAYNKGIPFGQKTMKFYMDQAEQTGLITTILGRRARFELYEPKKFGQREGAALPYELAILKWGHIRRAYLHKALNRLLQGSAADLMKAAMVKCWKDGVFDATGVPRLTVHDELDFSDPGGRDEAFREMKHILETAIPLRVPVVAEGDWGPNWGDVDAIPD